MLNQKKKINIIGGGLAGSEACLYLANLGYEVNLYDIKEKQFTPAHHNPNFAEIVCSNSFKSDAPDSASGILKNELTLLGSTLIKTAYECRVPSGMALSVDRELFAEKITNLIKGNKNIKIHSLEVESFEDDAITIVATGPLTTNKLCDALKSKIGKDFLYFFDASSPIIDASTIDMDIAFVQDRYDKGDGDYLNLPMTKDEYTTFYNELINANTVVLKDFENKKIFEGCMPIEVLAKRGEASLRFGPLKPVGLMDKRKNIKPYAVVQLRKENIYANMYNMVGFQTNLTYPEQKRVFSLIPGLKDATFLKYGVMHRNNFINYPKVCDEFSRLKTSNNIFIAGQLSGVEGYVESIASGLYCAINVHKMLSDNKLIKFSNSTIIGGMYQYLINANADNFQPINANLGLLEPINVKDKKKRNLMFHEISAKEIKEKLMQLN
ncbi:MAG: methylenetetrahydrofolate--tRNA-(uracil(54)-C(5))-methyltransferase (FADH(2)-oxidizing) TrmFO [Clostridia bacterium]|nr:methylenetetrahydrofolate--tRNA-(uracil(54)-C(5))-methyltransferase (FADH(2)-oxidizing) TrmFO [Clostridia bacterium]